MLGSFVGCVWIGCKVADRLHSKLLGWVAGILAFGLSALLFGPAINDLKERACGGKGVDADDFAACMEGENYDY